MIVRTMDYNETVAPIVRDGRLGDRIEWCANPHSIRIISKDSGWLCNCFELNRYSDFDYVWYTKKPNFPHVVIGLYYDGTKDEETLCIAECARQFPPVVSFATKHEVWPVQSLEELKEAKRARDAAQSTEEHKDSEIKEA